jgi:hypothetical protein
LSPREQSRLLAALGAVAITLTTQRALAADLPFANSGRPAVDEDKIVTVGVQPLAALLTQRFGIELGVRIAEHHRFVITPYYVYFASRDWLALINGDTTQTIDHVRGEGIEFGYHYRTSPLARSKLATARVFGGPSAIIAQYVLTRGDLDSKSGVEKLESGIPYSRRGFAFDLGVEGTVLPVFYLSIAFGLEYAWTSKSLDAAPRPPLAATAALYGQGLRPRVGGAVGFTF